MFKLILFVLINIKFGYSYPDGAPGSVCTSMMPQHDVAPKQCQPKYIIQSEKTEYNLNDIIRITVRGLINEDHFKGILLIAKNKDSQQIVGTWSTNDESLKTVSCNDKDNTAITHKSNDKKLQIEALWHAPSIVYEKNTIIKATIVKSFDEIYVDCFSITLTAKQYQLTDVQSVNVQAKNDIITKPNTNLTLDYADNTVTVTITSEHIQTGDWRAIGFSLDREMSDEYVFICQVSNVDSVSLRRMHTKLGKRPPSNSTEIVNIINTLYENGRLTCKFSFETNSEQAENEPAPIVIEKEYYILYAAGILRTNNQIAKHNFTFVTPTTFQLQQSRTIILNDLFESTIVTGETTTTTAVPSTDDVKVNINWTYADGATTIRMMINNLRTSNWCALGLSVDDEMGEDHVFICQRLSNDTISLGRFINPNGHTPPASASTIANPGGTMNVIQVKLENDVVYCDFTLSNFVNVKRQSRQNNILPLSQTTIYRPLIAIGKLSSSNSLLRHGANSRTPLYKDVSLNRPENIFYGAKSVDSDSTSLMKAHGIIMVFVWILFAPTGILIARYFKRSWADKKICNKAVWFVIHRTIMTSVAILILIAFILILVYKKGQWVSKRSQVEFAHSIVGILVISFAVIQPIMALFRCHPNDQYRFIFNYAHATVGLSALLLSIVTIFLAMFFTQFQFNLNKEWGLLIGWACWVPIVFILFQIIEIYFQKSSITTEKPEEYNMDNNSNSVTTKVQTLEITESVNKNRIKKILILIHIAVAFGFTLALAIVIGKS